MNSLREKLLQAGLVTEEDARRSEASKKKSKSKDKRGGRSNDKASKGRNSPTILDGRRNNPSNDSRPPLSKEERLSPEEIALAEEKRKEREREAALCLEREQNRKRAALEKAKAEDIRRVAAYLGVDVAGDRVFHFTTRKKKLQRMLVSEEAVSGLEGGQLAIVDNPLPHALEYAVVSREGAEAVLKIEPRALRFYNRSETERYGISE